MELVGYNEYNSAENYKLSKSIAKGIIRGAKDLGEIVLHPIDNIVYPISELVYDATIMTLQYQTNKSRNNSDSLYKRMLEKNPQLYINSSKRMNERINGAKNIIKDFASSPLEKQIESISALTTTVLVPGGLIKGIKYVKNAKNFGVGNPPKFHSIGDANLNYNIKTYNVEDIRALKNINNMIYVYTVDKELLISRSFQKTFDKTLFDPRMADKSGGFTIQILHPELAQLKPVYAAGEVIVNEGKIIELTNFSGHYQPNGFHLGTTIKNAFNKAGYGEVELSTYTEFFEYGANTIAIRSRLPGRGASITTFGTLAARMNEKDKSTKNDHTTEEYDIMMNDVPIKTKNAKQAYQQLALCAQEFYSDDSGINIRERLLNIAEPIHEFGVFGQTLSQLALTIGGHKRTWNAIGKISQASIGIASSLTAIGSAKSLISLGSITGGIGLAIGAIGFISALVGDDDGDSNIGEALQQIHQAVIAVHQTVIDMYKSMIDCFQRVEEVLIISVVGRLNQITNKLSRLEIITTQSFKELHTKNLIDLTDVIKKEIIGEHILTNGEKRSYLRQLSCWIDNHSKSSLQTQIVRNGGNISQIIEVLEETNLIESLPIFLNELINIIPDLKKTLDCSKINNLPNIEILSIACDIYMVASKRPGYCNNIETIKRAQQVFNDIGDIIVALTKFNICGESLINILTRQYDNYRFWVGQLICKAKGNDDWSKIVASLFSILKEGQDKFSLLEMLDEMELRRLCLIKLANLLNINIIQLESKNDILNRPANNYVKDNMYGVYVTKDLKRCLEMGVNPNVYDSWGKPLHYLTKNGGTARDIHLLFKTHLTLPIDMSGGTKYDQGDTWGQGSSSILHAMNLGKYDMGVLFCANGFDIRELDGRCGGTYGFNSTDMGNAYWWKDRGSIPSIINTRLVKLMNTPGNTLYRDQLRAAYKYYKSIESGNLIQDTGFTLDSLLLLTCVIGDIFPLNYYLHKKNKILDVKILNQCIEGLGITYLQFAKSCKQPIVVNYLKDCGALLDIESTVDVSGLYDENVKDLPLLIWQINTFNTDLITYPVNSSFADNIIDIKLKIESYLNLSTNIFTKPFINDDCVLFRDLLTEVINTVPSSNKFHKSINDKLKFLNKAIDTGDIKSICSSFNTINSILIMIKDLPIPYTLHSGIINLIDDIKSMDE
jgi:hypothetical protein